MSHPTDLAHVRAPIAQANGLPNAHYTDPMVHDLETRKFGIEFRINPYATESVTT